MNGISSPQVAERRSPEAALKTAAVSRWREWRMFANLLSLARIALVPLFVWSFLSPHWQLRILSLVVFIAAAITDWWDGHHARTHKTVTNLGKFLDPLADKLLTITALITLVYQQLVMWWMVAIIFARDLILTWIRLRAATRGARFTTLWLAKLKTTVQLSAIIVIILFWSLHSLARQFDFNAHLVSHDSLVLFFNALVGVTMVLAVLSGAQYFARRSPASA